MRNVNILYCVVDADWVGGILGRKSTTKFVIRFFGQSWKTKKQNITKSTTFAEHIALSEAVTEMNVIV